MNKAQLIGLSAVAVAFVVGVNVFAMNANSGQEEKSNGVANEEPVATAAESGGAVAYEDGGSFDINAVDNSSAEDSFTVNVAGENMSGHVVSDNDYSGSGDSNATTGEVIDDAPVSFGIELSEAEHSELNNMFNLGEQSDIEGLHESGVSEDEMKKNRYTILKAAKSISERYDSIYKSELIALAMIRGGYGNDLQAFKYNNYFHITAEPEDSNAVTVQYTTYEGEERTETLRKFSSADECFEYMTKNLIKAGLCKPLSYAGLLKQLYNKGYLKTKLDLQNFHQQVLQYDTTNEFPDMLDTDRDVLISEIIGEREDDNTTDSSLEETRINE